jgi:hypothetical protein
MATEAMKTNPNFDSLFRQLAGPFDSSEIYWRVSHTARDGNRGVVIAFADPRASTDRLNQRCLEAGVFPPPLMFTPTGWTRTCEVSTVSSVTRMKKDKLIETGKVLVTCTLIIAGLGCHAGSGEEWADEENAMTAAMHWRSSGQQAVAAWGDTFTTWLRCGFLSMSAGSQSIWMSPGGSARILPRYERGDPLPRSSGTRRELW